MKKKLNLDQVKGVIEIAGVKFSATQLLKSLADQGISISFNNKTLRVGQKFLKPEVFLEEEYKTCPNINICKVYDEIIKNMKREAQLSKFHNGNQPIEDIRLEQDQYDTIVKDEIYEDRIELDDEVFNFPTTEGTEELDDPKEMIGVGTLTFGRPFPSKKKKCPTCGSIVNEAWLYCGKCGNYLGKSV